jgi:hypothetical protein
MVFSTLKSAFGIGAGKYAEAEGPSKSDEWFAQGKMVRGNHYSLGSDWLLYADQRTPFLDVDKMFGCLHLSFANLVACQFSMNF